VRAVFKGFEDSIFVFLAEPFAARKPSKPHSGEGVPVRTCYSQERREGISCLIPILLICGIDSEECMGEASAGFVDGGDRERKLCDCGEPIA
jgi:hypothetical protein